jgi:hypothetical protein
VAAHLGSTTSRRHCRRLGIQGGTTALSAEGHVYIAKGMGPPTGCNHGEASKPLGAQPSKCNQIKLSRENDGWNFCGNHAKARGLSASPRTTRNNIQRKETDLKNSEPEKKRRKPRENEADKERTSCPHVITPFCYALFPKASQLSQTVLVSED